MADQPIGFYQYFLQRLGDWAMGIPLQSFWVVIISFPKSIKDVWLARLQGDFEPSSWDKFSTNAYGGLVSQLYQEKSHSGVGTTNDEYLYGCMFARSVGIPGEKTELTSPSLANASGLIFPNITKNRSALAELDISFIETNSSFVDNVIRPWNIVVSHLGLVGRAESIKGKIDIIFYAKPNIKNRDYIRKTTSSAIDGDEITNSQILGLKDKPLIKRKIFTFYDVAPILIGSQEYTQAGDALIVRPTKFTYSSYSYSAPSIEG
jgi:hypothetical protein